jgi:hypothetical protein
MARASHPGHIVWSETSCGTPAGPSPHRGAVRVLPGFARALARPGVRCTPGIRSGCRLPRTCPRVTSPRAAWPAVQSRNRDFRSRNARVQMNPPASSTLVEPPGTAGVLRRSGLTLRTSHVCIEGTLPEPRLPRNSKTRLLCAETVGMFLLLWTPAENPRRVTAITDAGALLLRSWRKFFAREVGHATVPRL